MTETEQGKVLWSDQVEEEMPSEGVYDFEENITIVNIGGRTFRKANVARKRPAASTRERPGYQEEDFECESDEVSKLPIQYKEDPKGGMPYSLSVNIPNIFYKFLIGAKGQMRNKIQKETNTTIDIPKTGDSTENVVIRGVSERAILSAKTRIDLILQQSIEKLPFTHFLSIPLPGLRTEIKSFYKELLESFSPTSTPGFDESIFVDPSQLHLTILMLKLYTQEASEQASALLKSCMPKVYDLLQTRTEMIHCYGLEIMNDDPSSVDVLYLKLKEADGGKRLAAVCEYLVQAFRDAGLADPPDDHVKLHITLLNTRLRVQEEEEKEEKGNKETKTQKGKFPERIAFDARGILEKYGSKDFGEHKLECIHLSQRSKFDTSGYYHCVDKINFP